MNEEKIETVENGQKLLSIILRNDYNNPGVKFFTPQDFSQQMAFMNRKRGEVIQAHVHNAVKREIFQTQETLVIRKGKMKINFYDDNKNYLCSRNVGSGDVILLAGGGHGFEIIDDVEMIEIKQGPYLEKDDKIKFNGIEKNTPS